MNSRKCKRRSAVRLLRASNAGLSVTLAQNAAEAAARGYDRVVATQPEPIASQSKTWCEWGFDVATNRLGPPRGSRGPWHGPARCVHIAS